VDILFWWRYTNSLLFRERVSINCGYLINVFRTVFEKIILFLTVWRAPNFGAGLFIFVGHRPLMDKLLNDEYEQKPFNRSGPSETYVQRERMCCYLSVSRILKCSARYAESMYVGLNEQQKLHKSVLSREGVWLIDGVLDWILDLLSTYTHDSEPQAITAPSVTSTIYKSPQHPLNRSQPALLQEPFPGNGFNSGVSSASLAQVLSE
jgi:hypothetical protein